MCKVKIVRDDFENHIRNDCKDIKIICPQCKHEAKSIELSKHDCFTVFKSRIDGMEKREKFITEHYLKLLHATST